MNNKQYILIIGMSSLMGGIETYLLNLLKNSDKNKVIYDFLIIGNKKAIFENEINDFYGNNEHLYYVTNLKTNFFKTKWELNKFYSTIGKKYDFIYLNTCSTTKILYCYPYCKKYNIRLIVHSHNGNGMAKVNNAIFKGLLNRVAYKKLACSDVAAKWLYGSKNSKNVHIINNGIDTKKFQFDQQKREEIRKKYSISNDCIVVGHVGRFMEQKNHKYLIKIFDEIHKRNNNSVLLLIGTGELENEIKKEIDTLNLTNSVLFAGEQRDTSKYYSAMDVFILPSLYEGLPIVGVESQCAGLNCFFASTISTQVKLIKKSIFLPITESPAYWAKIILKSNISTSERKKYSKEVEKMGYDSQSTAKYLENIFLDGDSN